MICWAIKLPRAFCGRWNRIETYASPARRPWSDRGRLHDHLHGPRRHRRRGACHTEGIRLRHGHHGLDTVLVSLGLRAVSDSRRLAWRPGGRAPRAHLDRHLLVDLHLRHHADLEFELV